HSSRFTHSSCSPISFRIDYPARPDYCWRRRSVGTYGGEPARLYTFPSGNLLSSAVALIQRPQPFTAAKYYSCGWRRSLGWLLSVAGWHVGGGGWQAEEGGGEGSVDLNKTNYWNRKQDCTQV
ncbi:Uncharacterized protein APZ42_006350, partial [Daphnia magna]